MLNERIKMLREDRELNQRDFAKLIGVSQQTVASWETGRTSPDKDMLIKLSEFFSVSVDYLLKGKHITGNKRILSVKLEQFLEKYSLLNDEERITVETVLDIEVNRHLKREDTIRNFLEQLNLEKKDRLKKLELASTDESDFLYKSVYEEMHNENFDEFFKSLTDSEKCRYIEEVKELEKKFNNKSASNSKTEETPFELGFNFACDLMRKLGFDVVDNEPTLRAASGLTDDTDMEALESDFAMLDKLAEEKKNKNK